MSIRLGIDIGGSSLKAAPVDTETGELLAEPMSVSTPPGGSPRDIVRAARSLADQFETDGVIGCAFPAVIKQGVVHTAAHVSHEWIGLNGEELLSSAFSRPVCLLNDADAAGLAEIELGAAQGCKGVVMVLTFGTGIGTALFVDGKLLPNTELGHLMLERVGEAEEYASGRIRTEESLDWPAWAERANAVLAEYHRLLWPDLFVLGGGLTESYEEFRHLLRCPAQVRPARFRAQAGIVGAALAAASAADHRR